MSNLPVYRCTKCKRDCKRAELTVKKAVFLEMGEGARTVRSRVMEWLCESCLEVDPEYNKEKFAPKEVTVNG
jgi:hypothetical protein